MTSLQLPAELSQLILAGAWPSSEREANRQNLQTAPVPRDVVERLVPGENQIYLLPPPFTTIADRRAGAEREFWEDFGALDKIDPARALLIGDFGLGSDAVIALDYRADPEPPTVIRQAWMPRRAATSLGAVLSPHSPRLHMLLA